MKNEEIKEILDYIDDRTIPNEKWDKIKDYITNLQQENERLKEKIDILKSNFEVEIDDCEDYKKWYRDYKSRCEKAIELYKNCKEESYCILSIKMYEILIGSDDK